MRVHMYFIGWVVGPTKRYSSRYPAGDPEIAVVDDRGLIPSRRRVFERDYPGYGGITYLNGGLGYDVRDLYFGDSIVGNVTGVLAYQYGKYTLLFDSPERIVWESQPLVRPAVPLLDPRRGAFDICYFNAENLFDHLNDGHGDWGDWAPGWPYAGTDAGEGGYRYKLLRIADVIANWLGGCALVGLEEVEGKQQVWDDLAAEVTRRAHSPYGQRTWAGRYVEAGDPRDISQGFLIRDDVALLGGALGGVQGQPYTGWVSDGVLDFVRTPAAGRFRFNAGRPEQVDVWAYNMHFKSKAYSTSCATDDCVDVREREAADLRDILLHHRSLGEYAIAGGDLNDTHGSSPIAILDGEPGPDGGLLTGLWYELPEGTRYSYIFNGESQALDHVYVTNLAVGPQPWQRQLYPMHVAADLPAREQASDHDPLRVVFWLRAEGQARSLPSAHLAVASCPAADADAEARPPRTRRQSRLQRQRFRVARLARHSVARHARRSPGARRSSPIGARAAAQNGGGSIADRRRTLRRGLSRATRRTTAATRTPKRSARARPNC